MSDVMAVMTEGIVDSVADLQHNSTLHLQDISSSLMQCIEASQLYWSGGLIPGFHILQGRHYVIESEIDSFAGRDAVMDVLTDYENHSSVFSSIQSSQVIDRTENEADVLQVIVAWCLLARRMAAWYGSNETAAARLLAGRLLECSVDVRPLQNDCADA